MKRAKVIAGVLAVLVGMMGVGGRVPPAAAQDHAYSSGCTSLNDAFWSGQYTTGTGVGYNLYGYESLRFSAGEPVVGAPERIELRINGETVGSVSYPGPLVYLVPVDRFGVTFTFTVLPLSAAVTWDVSCSYTPPGCDMVPIPAGAVVGKFVANAPVYWTPGKLADPAVTIPAGMTAWVFNLDAGGQYYRVLWACSIIYVPRGTLAPNPDAVWHSAPLPGKLTLADGTQIVQGGATGATGSVAAGVYPVNSAPVDAAVYVVQRGDNLYRIALHFGVSLAKLAEVNGIADPARIYAGQVLDIAAAR